MPTFLVNYAHSQVHEVLGIDASGSKATIVSSVAEWLKDLESKGQSLESCPEWCSLLAHCPSLKQAVEVSNVFYNRLNVPLESCQSHSELMATVVEEMPVLQLPRFSLAVHQSRVYWGSCRIAAEPGLDYVAR